MKRAIKWIILILILGGGGAGVFFYQQSQPQKPLYITAEIQTHDLIQTVDATGSISSTDDIDLSFKVGGQIQSISIEVGDHVMQDQILAELSADKIRSEVDRAKANIQATRADLDELLAGSTKEEIAVAREEVQNAKIKLNSEQGALTDLIEKQTQTRTEYKSTALQAISDKAFINKFTLQVIYDAILDPEAEAQFKTSNSFALEKATESHGASNDLLSDSELAFARAQNSYDQADILEALDLLDESLRYAAITLDESLTVLTGAIANSTYTTVTIDGFKTSMNTQATAVGTARTAVRTSINNFTSDEVALQETFNAAEFTVSAAEGSLKLAEAKLDLAQADPQQYEIRQLQARISQAIADLTATESSLADTLIKAPLGGIITAVNFKPGEQAPANSAVLTMIGDSQLLVEVDIPESDINKIQVGDATTVSLDAFGQDTIFNGTVLFIEPAERLLQDVVYYRVKVTLQDDSEMIKPGMTANVTVMTAERADVLAIPVRAISYTATGDKIVKTLVSGTVSEKNISTGIRGDDGMVEILAGLSSSDIIILGENK